MAARCTLAAPARHEILVRKSRFLAQAAPADSETVARAFIAAVSDPAATHNCWAWRIGAEYRSSDDGEPGGSAGRPILAAIDGQDCDRVVVVVTRWFGGIKLGVGGLVRAYGGAAAECLRQAPRVELLDLATVRCTLAHAEMELLRARIQPWSARVVAEDFRAEGVTAILELPRDRLPELAALVGDLSRGRQGVQLLEPPDATA